MDSSPYSKIHGVKVKSPSWRYRETLDFLSQANYTKKKNTPKDFSEGQNTLVEIHRNPESSPESPIRVAILLENIPASRAILRGLLMSGDSLSIISRIIEESEECILAYEELFFDTSVFRNKLIKVAYIRSLPQDDEDSKFEKQMISWGHYLGSGYISWKIGANREREKANPSQVIQGLLDDSVWRSKEHCLSSITAAETKEARAWVPQVLKSAEMLRDIESATGMENALTELKIKLEGSEQTILPTDLEGEIKG